MLSLITRFLVFRRSFLYLTQYRCFSGNQSGDFISLQTIDGETETDTRKQQLPNPRVTLSVVCDGADGSSSMILSSWPYSYVFNFGEGYQMSCAAYGKGTKSTNFTHQHMFVTHSSWKNVGGILGYLQGDAHGKIPHTLHGPCQFKELLNSLKRTTTVYLSEVNAMKLNIMKESRTHFEDSQLRIDYVKIPGDYSVIYGQKKEKLAFAYIIKPKRCYKNFDEIHLDARKLVDLNIRWGSHTGALSRGETVTLDDGTIVTPEQVSKKNPIKYNTGSIVVLECPTESYLDSLLAAPEFIDLPKDPEWSPDLIVHLSPWTILKSKPYRKFMHRFSGQTTHYILNEASYGRYCSVYESYHQPLTAWSPDLFPALDKTYFKVNKPQPGRTSQGYVGQRYAYREKKWSIVPPKDVNVTLPVKTRKPHVQRTPVNLDEYPEIVFLGTGSSMPHLTRNVAGILVQMRKDEYIMLDCGENTLRQMTLLYGDETKNVLQNLKAIYVSHKHYDHLGGVPAILDQWAHSTQHMDPMPYIYLLCPIEMKEILLCYTSLLGGKDNRIRTIYHNPLFAWKDSRQTVPPDAIKRMEDFKTDIGFEEYLAVVVPHQRWLRAYGTVIKHKDGWKIVYTGDTTHNCYNLIELGKDCDILIHDATFPDHATGKAKVSGHSTYQQAIENGKKMGAKFTILTHFSNTHDGCQYATKNVGIAFDHMKFRPSQGAELSELDLIELDTSENSYITHAEALEAKKYRKWVKRQPVPKQRLDNKTYRNPPE